MTGVGYFLPFAIVLAVVLYVLRRWISSGKQPPMIGGGDSTGAPGHGGH